MRFSELFELEIEAAFRQVIYSDKTAQPSIYFVYAAGVIPVIVPVYV